MEIKKVGVLGCGVMGGQIAAHLNNVGLDVIAFDLDKEKSIFFAPLIDEKI